MTRGACGSHIRTLQASYWTGREAIEVIKELRNTREYHRKGRCGGH